MPSRPAPPTWRGTSAATRPTSRWSSTLRLPQRQPSRSITTDTGVSDGVTSDTTLVIAGTAEAAGIVTVYKDGASIGTTTASGAGVFGASTTPGPPSRPGAMLSRLRPPTWRGTSAATRPTSRWSSTPRLPQPQPSRRSRRTPAAVGATGSPATPP